MTHALVLACFAAALLLPVYARATGDLYALTVGARAFSLALAALSLAFLLGTAGLVSLGHATCFGLGAYAVAISGSYGLDSLPFHLAAAVVVSTLFMLVTGAVALRTTGVFFIMITLAFAQMGFYFFVGMRPFGGDDGLPVATKSFLGSLRLADPTTLYLVALVALAAFYVLFRRIANSRFGLVLVGGKLNERRIRAMGVELFAYRLTAYCGAGAVASVAGMLFANVNGIATPSFLGWQQSGDLLIMVVIGGIGSLPGSILGAFVVLALETLLPAISSHWEMLLGGIFIAAAFAANSATRQRLRHLHMRQHHAA